MADLIFSVKNVFNDETSEGCLHQMDAIRFHIPTYQRGYKWGSKDKNDPVPTLLRDIETAFNNAPEKKYYLQYITISKREHKRLEVIDGQQRLTTLSILLSVFNHLLDLESNIALNKLHYAIRLDIFSDNIYPKDQIESFATQNWEEDGINLNGLKVNNQDVYYLHNAAKYLFENLKEKDQESLTELFNFILNQVVLIVNEVEPHIDGEKVFKNLNSNKVPLTEVDLIKGLLLTKVARVDSHSNRGKHFREVVEIRASLGRKWDQMSAQANEPEFSYLFFEEGNGFEAILNLVALMHGYVAPSSNEQSHFPLFNFYNSNVGKILELFNEILWAYEILNDWHSNPFIINLFGYASHIRGDKKIDKMRFLSNHLKKSKMAVKQELIKIRTQSIGVNLDELKYGERDHEIYNVLLAVNVFSKLNSNRVYNFYEHNKHSWTLEHIFPQHPEGKNKNLSARQRELIVEMLGGKEHLSEDILKILKKDTRTDEEKQMYSTELAKIGPLNKLGNMALLSGPINSSVGCGFFDEKRKSIIQFMNDGAYIPPHTFNVFSKAILGDNPGNLDMWTKEDMDNHSDAIKVLVKTLNEE